MVVDQVTAFYRFHFAHDMGFTRETVKAPSVWLTPGLLKICAVYFANPGAPMRYPLLTVIRSRIRWNIHPHSN
jgi:hypothetical protein